ncbi:hypothetical protein LSTR_LSTR011478 [Laodelphax striatellus]|uniref:Carboxylic ester hydrolase n=1 Tax=Laodelphax striatellus TaxID=195883 RepID=A0A482WHT4_LAOST|nr:hypothetical protein LSTR_LSTR011478 [Laodelphax striatellus]
MRWSVLVWLLWPTSTLCLVREPPSVAIPGQGLVSGREVNVARGRRATLYLGLPFAQPPLEALRFAPPVTDPLPSWDGVRNASLYSPACPQDRQLLQRHDRLRLVDRLFAGGAGDHELFRTSEDCLYLNVFVPDGNPPAEGWQVLVWFHEGNFSVGAASLWDATAFAVKQRVLVVTSSYRLNVFGFLSTLDGMAPGNAGLLDQVAALDWVHAKITTFGGSTQNVVLAGHSAGAESVTLHMLSPLSEGKFSRAIAMSGSALAPGTIRSPQKDPYLADLAERFECKVKPTSELLDCLRQVSEKDLLKEAIELADWGPIVDFSFVNDTAQAFLPAEPSELLAADKFNKVDFLTGFTDMERAFVFAETLGSDFNKDVFQNRINEEVNAGHTFEVNSSCTVNYELLYDSVIFFYSPALHNEDVSVFRKKYLDFCTEKYYAAGAFLHATYVSKTNVAYVYRFDYKLKTNGVVDLEEWMNVPHMMELPIVWGMPYWTSFVSPVVWNNADRKQTDIVMSLWGNFSKASTPAATKGRGVQWEPFTEESPGVLIIDKNIEMSDISTFDYKATKFWNYYYPKLTEASTTCCNTTAGAAPLVAFTSSAFLLLSIAHATTL